LFPIHKQKLTATNVKQIQGKKSLLRHRNLRLLHHRPRRATKCTTVITSGVRFTNHQIRHHRQLPQRYHSHAFSFSTRFASSQISKPSKITQPKSRNSSQNLKVHTNPISNPIWRVQSRCRRCLCATLVWC